MIMINMYLILAWYIVLLLINIKRFRPFIKYLRGNSFKLFVILLLLLFAAYLFSVTHVLRVMGDEAVYLANSINYHGQVVESMLTKALYHLTFIVFGLDIYNAIWLNMVLSMLSLFLLYLIFKEIFKSEIIAIASPMVLGVSTGFIASATSAYSCMVSIFFTLLAVLIFLVFLKSDSFTLEILLVVSLAVLPLIRIEYIILIPIHLFWRTVFGYRKLREFKYLVSRAAVWILILIPIGIFDYLRLFKVWISPWISGQECFLSLYNLISAFNAGGIRSYILASFFLILAFSLIHLSRKRNILLIALYPLSISFAFLILYNLNSYTSPRFYIPVYAFCSPIFIAPILFAKKKKTQILLISVLIFLLSWSFINSRQQVNTVLSHDYVYFKMQAPDIIKEIVPQGCMIVTGYAPDLVMGTGLKNVHSAVDLINDPALINRSHCVYLFEDFLCQDDSFRDTYHDCRNVLHSYNWTIVTRIEDKRVGEFYNLYRLSTA